MPGVAAEWFPGEAGDADGEAFLAELRRRVGARGLVDARPEDTTLHAWSEGMVIVLIDVPGLQGTEEKPVLEVLARYGADDPGLMTGWETHGYLTDSYDPLDLGGVEATPQALARRAFDWFESELRRPLETAYWRTWRGESSVVRSADTGEPVWGHVSRQRRRRGPDRVVRLR